MIVFAPVKFDVQSLARYQSLFSTCFSNLPKFEPHILRWLYAANPDGCAIGFDAFEGDELAAHYVCIPATIRVDGVVQKTLLSLNTATHPRYQGKGLFTKLADMTYREGANQGFNSVYGIANANSTPGFIRKLGFQLVQPLRAMVGVGRIGIDFAVASRNSQFERVWTPESLKWRCSNPMNPVRSYFGREYVGFQARAIGPMLTAYAELSAGMGDGLEDGRSVSPLRLYLGLVPDNACKFSSYVSIPDRLRPSPLNLIYRPLTKELCHLEAGFITFSFLDFDAY
jgi:GNAT superfamily N-acetyltransferase